jgi:excinuclease ABC subunit A
VLHRLTDLGNSIIIIEHNMDVIRNADWLLDLGPEGGEDGGRIVAQGTPEQVARVKKSYTGQTLAKLLRSAPNAESTGEVVGVAQVENAR